MSNCLTYSKEAGISRALISAKQLNIIVEDTDKEYLYEKIFSRIFSDYEFNVSAVGGKLKVKEMYENYGRSTGENPNKIYHYLLDGDFERYTNPQEMICDSCLTYLKTYNIENYYICENSICDFVKGKARLMDELLNQYFDYYKWKITIESQATKLFLLYAYIQKYYPEEKNVSHPAELFLDTKTGFEKSDSSNLYLVLKDNYMNKDPNFFDRIENMKLVVQNEIGDNFISFICGKFLLKSLKYCIQSISTPHNITQFSVEDFSWQLIDKMEIANLDYLKRAVINSITNPNA